MNRKYFTPCEAVIKNDFIISGIIDHVETAGACDGEIGVTVVGGDAPYTYNYTGPNGYTNPSTSIGDLTGLCGGVYNLTVTDANGGTSTISFTVNEPATLTCSVVGSDSLNSGGNGSLFINAFGGSPDYYYSIDGNPPVSMAPNSSVTVPIPAGIYVVDVIDGNGMGSTCTNPTTGVTISEPPALTIQGLGSATDTTCGLDNGTISVTLNSAIGGTPPYTTEITSSNTNSNDPAITTTTYSSNATNVTNLMPGTYTVTTTDSGYALDASGNTISSPQMDSITFTIGASITPTITITPYWYCWRYPDTVNTAFINIQSGYISATFNTNIQQIEVIEELGSTQTTIATLMGANAITQLYALDLKPKFYRFILTDTTGCVAETTSDFTPNLGQVPSAAQRILYVPENYCWTDSLPPQIRPKFQVWCDGPFEITNMTTGNIYTFAAVPNGSFVTITTIQPTSTGTIFKLKETTHNCEVSTPLINLSAQTPIAKLTASINQNGSGPCLTYPDTPTTTTITCNANGGWSSSYTYAWTINGNYAGATATIVVPVGNCGDVYRCLVTDAEGCIQLSNIEVIN